MPAALVVSHGFHRFGTDGMPAVFVFSHEDTNGGMPAAWESPADLADFHRERFGMPLALRWLTDYTDFTDLGQMRCLLHLSLATNARIAAG